MSGLSVIIPSRNASNLVPCIEALRNHEPNVRIFVINDGLEHHPALIHPVSYLPGIRPFIFARNCNLGIQAAGSDDVVLLNDDALLETDGGFSAMQSAAALCPQFGLVSATTNVAGNPEQWRRPLVPGGLLRRCPKTPGNSFPTVAFVCVLIPRSTIETVGVLDERYGGITTGGKRIYGFDDNDYCRRLHIARLQVGICDGCFVNHSKLTSTFRTEAHDMEAARAIYLKKWGTM